LPDALIFQENANVFIDPVVLAASDQTEFPLITWDETQQLTRGVFDTLPWQFSRDARLVSEPQVEFRPDSRMVVVTNVSLVPEPSCALLAMVGVLGVWLLPRRVRQAARRV